VSIELLFVEEDGGLRDFRPGRDGVESIDFYRDGVRVQYDDDKWAWYPNARVWKVQG
jgi:hypothetical protein